MNITNSEKHILIAAITPYFLEKESFWFQENLEKILQARKTQNFFEDNLLFIEVGQDYNFSQILRKLDEMGYEKVFKVQEQGEMSQRGGLLEIFPINSLTAIRLDFLGNTLESIQKIGKEIIDEAKTKEILKKRLKSHKLYSDLKNLKEGDFLVHLDHGIGKFVGMQEFNFGENDKQKYYVLEYDQSDKLYVPNGLEIKLSKYVSFQDPKLSRLGSVIWQKTKRAIKEEVEKLANELLSLYSQKEISSRQRYVFDKDLDSEIRTGFAYQETPDQLRAIEDIENDLKREKPMDRIICGDVGFGKTEIAIRASLMAISNNKQVAIMCPTTILANQHFQNFTQRFRNLPARIAILSRLQTKTEQKEIIRKLNDGLIDILIGTHRILSPDIKFRSLQLLIIDDEQRFGVKQKEKLRKIKPDLDILSLSATPIPRTIYLALSSFKNISLVQTPPEGRTSIKTFIEEYDENKIKKAICAELKRKGQVYFLHNRVESIEKIKSELEKLVPHAKMSFLHGRMNEKQIMKVMDDFQNKRTNVLVATTIIENGIDLANANTIIIEDATRLGLAQAYQIKGRVGRSFTQGFAYLFYKKQSLTPLANERLNALKEAEELGSGYRIAIKDLELRGAGNILGKEQSGSINKIGLNLYSQMLSEAVEKLRDSKKS